MVKASAKGLRPLEVFLGILFVRIVSVFVVQTWFVPDEYWQSMEIAHKQVFGYGGVTWEWQQGIRSYLYPSIISALYTVLKYTNLDYAEAVVILPRILQAVLSSYADYSFYKWTGGRKWALFLTLTSWFWFYTASRTLLQTTETALLTIALSMFPFKDGILSPYEKENTKWIWIACVCVFLRPTSAPLWIVLGLYNLLTTNQLKSNLILRTYMPIILLTSGTLIALDSYFYGRLIVTPWEFFRFNVLHDIASFYGKHPWHWYLIQGIPSALGINLLPVLWAIVKIVQRPKERKVNTLLLIAIGVHVALYSFIPHKEIRFVLPLLPMFLYLAQDVIVPWSRKAHQWQLFLVAGIILLANAVPVVYFGVMHQSASTKVMPLLRDAITSNRSSIAFLTPCHSTPLYSHLHVNVTTRYLHCDPPLDKLGQHTYEMETFYNNPLRWWRGEYATKQTPDLVVMFDVLRGRLEPALAEYSLLYELPHTRFIENEVSAKLLVFKKKQRVNPQDDVV